MFCAKCGKQFQGEGYLCPQCAQANDGYVIPAACFGSQAPQAPVAPVVPEAPVMQQPSVDYTAPAGGYTPPAYQQPVYQQPAYQQPAYQAAPAPQEPSSQPTPGFTLSSPDDGAKKPGKKNKGLVIGLGILALVLIVGIVVVALNWNNWFGGKKGGVGDGDKPVIINPEDIPEDPDDYIAFLHEVQAAGLTKDLASAYGSYMGSADNGMAIDTKLKLTMGKQLLGLLEDAMAESGVKMDINWLKEISLSYSVNANGTYNQAVNLALAIGKQTIVSVDAMVDIENMTMYMGIPELSKKYAKVDMSDAGVEYLGDLALQLLEDMPSEEEIQALLDGYVDILLSYLDDATKEEVTLVAGKGSEDVTALTVTITQEDFMDLYIELLEYTRDNKTARKIMQAFIDYAVSVAQAASPYADVEGLDMEGFEQAMDELIDEAKAEKAYAEEGNYIVVTTYANLAEIRGYDILVYADGEPGPSANFYFVEDGGKVYVDILIDAIDSYAGASGALTKKSGKLNGELALQVDGEELATIGFKNVVDETGYGTYVITPNPLLLDELGMNEMASSLISGVSFELEVKENALAVSIVNSKGTLVTLELSATAGKGRKVTFPTNVVEVEDDYDMERWAESLDIGKLLDNLKKAGLPNDLYKMLKQMIG